MAYGGIDPFPQPVSMESLRIQFKTQMTVYIIGKTDHKENEQMPAVDGNREQKDDENK